MVTLSGFSLRPHQAEARRSLLRRLPCGWLRTGASVIAPTLELLTQTVEARRAVGQKGPAVVFATYADLPPRAWRTTRVTRTKQWRRASWSGRCAGRSVRLEPRSKDSGLRAHDDMIIERMRLRTTPARGKGGSVLGLAPQPGAPTC